MSSTSKSKIRSATPKPPRVPLNDPMNTLIPPRSLSPPVKIPVKNYRDSKSRSVVVFKRNLEGTGRYSPFKPPKGIDSHGVIPLYFNPPQVGVCFIIKVDYNLII